MNSKKNILKEEIYSVSLIIWILGGLLLNFSYFYELFNISDVIKTYLYLIVRLFSYSLIVYKIFLFDKFTIKKILIIILIGFFFLISTYLSNEGYLLDLFIFGISIQNVRFEKLIKKIAIFELLFVTIIVLLSCFNVITNDISYRGSIPRYHLGFIHANTLGVFLMQISLMFFYILSKRKAIFFNFLFLIFLIISYLTLQNICRSRTTAMLLVVLFFAFIFRRIFDKIPIKLLFTASIIILFVCTIFSVYAAFNYNNSNFVRVIDSMISSRFYYINKIQTTIPLTLFGYNIPFVSGKESMIWNINAVICDNTYCLLLFNCGIVIFLGFIYSYLYSLYCCYKSNNRALLVILCILFIMGVVDNGIIKLNSNVFSLIPFYCFFNIRIKKTICNINCSREMI